MPTECSGDLFGFTAGEGREVVAAFDGGAITSDAGALLLGATDRAIGMMERIAACFHDERRPMDNLAALHAQAKGLCLERLLAHWHAATAAGWLNTLMNGRSRSALA